MLLNWLKLGCINGVLVIFFQIIDKFLKGCWHYDVGINKRRATTFFVVALLKNYRKRNLLHHLVATLNKLG